jgi:hypothetical protein
MFELIEALHRRGDSQMMYQNIYLGSAIQNMNLERIESCSMLPQEISFTQARMILAVNFCCLYFTMKFILEFD